MAVLFSVFVTIHRVVFVRQAEPLDRVAVQAFGRSFLVGQIQSGFLHPFETLHVVPRLTVYRRQAIERLLPVRQLRAQVTERYLVPVRAEQSQETVFLVEPRVLEIRSLRAQRSRVIKSPAVAVFARAPGHSFPLFPPHPKKKKFFFCCVHSYRCGYNGLIGVRFTVHVGCRTFHGKDNNRIAADSDGFIERIRVKQQAP